MAGLELLIFSLLVTLKVLLKVLSQSERIYTLNKIECLLNFRPLASSRLGFTKLSEDRSNTIGLELFSCGFFFSGVLASVLAGLRST